MVCCIVSIVRLALYAFNLGRWTTLSTMSHLCCASSLKIWVLATFVGLAQEPLEFTHNSTFWLTRPVHKTNYNPHTLVDRVRSWLRVRVNLHSNCTPFSLLYCVK